MKFAIMRDLQMVKLHFTLGRVAQSVEQRIENPRVTGSIPVPATSFFSLRNLAHTNSKPTDSHQIVSFLIFLFQINHIIKPETHALILLQVSPVYNISSALH